MGEGASASGAIANTHKHRSLAGVAAPTVFVAAWFFAGVFTRADYSPIDDAISRLAAVDSDVRWFMTAGFVLFAGTMQLFANAVRVQFDVATAGMVSANGFATLAVAATPLDNSPTIDQLHNVAAISGYLSLAAIPLLARSKLRERDKATLAGVGMVAALVAAISLSLSALGLPTGLFQRLGLTVVDIWIAVFALTGMGKLVEQKLGVEIQHVVDDP